MTITLNPEQEQIIQAEIANGHFRTPEEVLDHALAALQKNNGERNFAPPQKNLAQFLMESPLAGDELNWRGKTITDARSNYERISARYEWLSEFCRPTAD